MTKGEVLREIQRRIAEAKGYRGVRAGDTPDGALVHAVTPEIYHDLPRWPWEWSDAGALVEEMERDNVWWDAHRVGPVTYHFKSSSRRMVGVGATFAEAIARAWCAYKRVDLSDLP